MKTAQRGFTLIEMMAVLAIIAILALMAVPSYMDRTVRQQIEAALPLADIAKKPVADAWGLLHAFPADNAATGLPVAEKVVSNHVSSLSVEDGAIHITFGKAHNLPTFQVNRGKDYHGFHSRNLASVAIP